MRDLTLTRTTAIICVIISLHFGIYAAVTQGDFELLGMVITTHSLLLGFTTILHGND